MALREIRAAEPDQELVDLLEEMLAQAKRGELRGLVGVAVRTGRQVDSIEFKGDADPADIVLGLHVQLVRMVRQ